MMADARIILGGDLSFKILYMKRRGKPVGCYGAGGLWPD